MSDVSRRHLLGGVAAGSALAAIATDGAAQPSSGSGSGLLAGKELPSLRFPLSAQPRKDYDGGWAKEATVAEFPVSEKLAGVLMELAPGGLQIRDAAGEVIGAVGVTGDTEDRDEELAAHGIRSVGLKTDEDCAGMGRAAGIRLTNK